VNSALEDASGHPVLKAVNPQPSIPHTPMGDAIPSAFVDRNASGNFCLYVVYGYHDGGQTPAADGIMRVARARLGEDPLVFEKWFNGASSQPGIGGLDTGVLPGPGCTGGQQAMAEISRHDDLGLYLMVFVCRTRVSGTSTGAWYYSTATNLDLQDWTAPKMIAGSQFPITSPCPGLTTGGQFDGWYPSLVSPGAAAGPHQAERPGLLSERLRHGCSPVRLPHLHHHACALKSRPQARSRASPGRGGTVVQPAIAHFSPPARYRADQPPPRARASTASLRSQSTRPTFASAARGSTSLGAILCK